MLIFQPFHIALNAISKSSTNLCSYNNRSVCLIHIGELYCHCYLPVMRIFIHQANMVNKA